MSIKIGKEWLEKFLKRFPQFMSDWIVKNVSRETLLEWKQEMIDKKQGLDPLAASRNRLVNFAPRSSSSSTKIHVQDEEGDIAEEAKSDESFRRKMTIKDLSEMIEDGIYRKKSVASVELKRAHLRHSQLSTEKEELFFELVMDIAQELAVDVLCYKILSYTNLLTESDRGSIFLVRVNNKGERYLESRLHGVLDPAGRVCTPMQEGGIVVKVPFGVGIAGLVALMKKPINVADAYQDDRFNKDVDQQTGYHTTSILSMPIFNCEDAVIGVAQIINKQGGTGLFTTEDEVIFEKFLVFCGISLTNAELFGLSLNEFKRNKMLLLLAKELFAEQLILDNLAKRIMLDLPGLINCDRCIFYLVEFKNILKKGIRITKAFDMIASEKTVVSLSKEEWKSCPATEFALKTAKSGKPDEFSALNSKIEPLKHSSGYVFNNVLSMPIFDVNNKVVGVFQLINKANNEEFNQDDVQTVTTFALFCGLGICNCHAYEEMVKLIARQNVTLEVLSYYATASAAKTEELANAAVVKSKKFNLTSLSFADVKLDQFETCKAIVTIFTELEIISHFKIGNELLCGWILSVKKNYRPYPYHNWRHAVNVTQVMFYCLQKPDIASRFTNLEIFALVVAALCHDLDHRPDASRVKQPLAMLYSTMSAEHHHIDQCIMLLNNEKTNILLTLTGDDHKLIVEMIDYCILSTDLTNFSKKFKIFQGLTVGGKIQSSDESQKLLRSMVMVGCDLSGACRPWAAHKNLAILVFKDSIKAEGDGSNPKRSSAEINKQIEEQLPTQQLDFLDSICLPLYTSMKTLSIRLHPMYDACMDNYLEWKKIVYGQKKLY